MKIRITHTRVILGVGAAMVLCASVGFVYAASVQSREENRVASQSATLTLSHAEQDDMSFKTSARRGNAHVTVIVQRKALRDEDFARNPEIDSPYDADIIIYNRYGYPLAFNTAGDIPVIDPISGETVGMQSPQDFGDPMHLNQAEQLEDLQAVVEMAESLRKDSVLGEGFRWEIRTIQNMGQWGLDHANDQIEGLVKPGATPIIQGIESKLLMSPISESAVVTNATRSGDYIYQAYIRWNYMQFIPPTWGHHSAVLVNVYYQPTGAFVLSISTSNHGTEAIDASMTTASGCPQAWGGRTLAIPQFQPYIGTDTYGTGDAGGCSTPYGLISGRHVCNDDSLAEYWNLKYNMQGSWATCADSTLRQFTPSCD